MLLAAELKIRFRKKGFDGIYVMEYVEKGRQ
jgi:hypothetical protein